MLSTRFVSQRFDCSLVQISSVLSALKPVEEQAPPQVIYVSSCALFVATCFVAFVCVSVCMLSHCFVVIVITRILQELVKVIDAFDTPKVGLVVESDEVPP